MSSVIETIERAQLRRVPQFAPGDRVRVHFQVIEGARRRVQVFEGVVIKRQGHGARETFTVRKQSFGVGVERSFPVHSPKIERVELAARGDVRRAKLYYLRDRVGKRARVRERRYAGPEQAVEPGLLEEPVAATDAEGLTAEETVMRDADAAPEDAAEAASSEDDAAKDQAAQSDAPKEESTQLEGAQAEAAQADAADEDSPAPEAGAGKGEADGAAAAAEEAGSASSGHGGEPEQDLQAADERA